MDDLLGEDWQKPAKPAPTIPPNTTAFANNYSSLRASPALPLSGNASPANLSRPSSTVNGAKAPTNDSFGNLLPLKAQKAGSSLSMQERQKQLMEEKRRQHEQQAQLWDRLDSGKSTPDIRQSSPAAQESEDDILAAFNKNAPVNKATYFSPPPPSEQVSRKGTPSLSQPPVTTGFDDDDDTFGLNELARRNNGRRVAQTIPKGDDEDDVLGDLARPVTQRPQPAPRHSLDEPMLQGDVHSAMPPEDELHGGEEDRALAELIDMGFPADTARIALAESGGNVQHAVGYLLQQAHEESRQQAREDSSRNSSRGPQPRREQAGRDPTPSWMRQGDSLPPRRPEGDQHTNGDRDPAQVAQEYGAKFFKSANALWKAGQKQVAKTVADFQQQDGESTQPRWMRDPSTESGGRLTSQRRPVDPAAKVSPSVDLTDEAAMLDAPRQRPPKPPRPSASAQAVDDQGRRSSPPVESLPQRPAVQARPRPVQTPPIGSDRRPTTKLSRQDVEDQTAQAYISPARRKKTTPIPEPAPEPEVDLFSPAPPKTSSPIPTPASSKPSPARPASRSSPAPPKLSIPQRNIPSISPSALAASATHRKAGGEHFKRGDYGAAHDSYTAALTPLPSNHPIAIIVLSNRSLTALKTGDAKQAITDADRALEIIGPGQGQGETIDLGSGEGTKEMKEFYGKAVMRKAEALEHLEKYADAAVVWRLAIAAGAGGSVSLSGRDRCDKAAGGASKAAAAPKTVPPRTNKPASRPSPSKPQNNTFTRPSASSNSAVAKLRLANAEAERADDEKFALSDAVDARLTAWRGGKTDNLRALLSTLDAVLWAEAGWKKVGMGDLIVPGRVKVVYMKAIAKVHPDKIPQDATTEQRMISGAVFATLNEAWDKFKTDNQL
ncbi:hypothetical protein BDY17DRAFT_298048 [Neohortaea acidophila]|uniref:UBA domain-containing protein n=1 Tax=Neohortaea acidophila TaxID=245834 RepID=A0A6A6PUJ4_9PEZI|nr:uncharacterized protein BDY17DRAFT_298048 [Neohortaea acidophila]KAF2483760.1 hypothetical protein BDY17DRAFT_298048 [Neohortaea acidophila]